MPPRVASTRHGPTIPFLSSLGLGISLFLAAPPARTEPVPSPTEDGYSALLLPGRVATIKSELEKQVTEVAVRHGASVRKGQLLLRFRDEEERVTLERAAAVVDRAESALKRIRRLHENQGASQETLEQAETELKLAEADRDLAGIRLGKLSLAAPFDGVVDALWVNAGASVETGDPLVRITALTPLRVEALLPESLLGPVRNLSAVRLKVSFPDTILTFPLTRAPLIVDAASGTFTLRGEIDNPRLILVPGVTCRLLIPRTAGAPR